MGLSMPRRAVPWVPHLRRHATLLPCVPHLRRLTTLLPCMPHMRRNTAGTLSGSFRRDPTSSAWSGPPSRTHGNTSHACCTTAHTQAAELVCGGRRITQTRGKCTGVSTAGIVSHQNRLAITCHRRNCLARIPGTEGSPQWLPPGRSNILPQSTILHCCLLVDCWSLVDGLLVDNWLSVG